MGKLKQIKRVVKAKPWKDLGLAFGAAAVAGSIVYILSKKNKKK